MPFDITLLTDDLKPHPSYQMEVEAASRAHGGTIGKRGVIRLPDGGDFHFDFHDFWPKKLTGTFCQIVFDVARKTNTYVTNAGSEVTPIKVHGVTLKTETDMGTAVLIATPAALCDALQGRLTRWNVEMGKLRAQGVIGADDQPLEPPPDPGSEPRLAVDTTGMVARCEKSARRMASELKWKVVRTIVSQNPKWGIVWRADIAPRADPQSWMRDMCWRPRQATGKTEFSMSSRPLEMFDPTKSIKPLPER